jgi:hypothetical protein
MEIELQKAHEEQALGEIINKRLLSRPDMS